MTRADEQLPPQPSNRPSIGEYRQGEPAHASAQDSSEAASMLDREPSMALVRIQDGWAQTRMRAPLQLVERRMSSDARGTLQGIGQHPAYLPVAAHTSVFGLQRAAQDRKRLTDERQRLVADALEAEDRARCRISQLLHDDVLQSLLSVRQDLAQAARAASRENDDALTHAREAVTDAIDKLRGLLAAEHAATRIVGGIQAAITAMAELHARRGSFEVTLRIEPEASGVHDQLIVSLVRELLNNAARHAQAGLVAISLSRRAGELVLEVTDDGCGMRPGRRERALAGGHLGLASITTRVNACGGQLRLTSAPGQGTRARIALPLTPSTESKAG